MENRRKRTLRETEKKKKRESKRNKRRTARSGPFEKCSMLEWKIV